MIKIIAGGKKNSIEFANLIFEYEKRLRKPFDISWQYIDEDRLIKYLNEWPFDNDCYVICCDERGENISSDEYSRRLEGAFLNSKNVVILIGGAYGFTDEIRKRADFVWSFSKLVFPHMIARLIAVEQTYRAQEIARGGKYHHE